MIDERTMAKLEQLAGLKLSPEERERLKTDLTRILDYFQKLGELDTEGVPPFDPLPGRVNAWREDEPEPSLSPEEALRNAPQTEREHFKVPRVFGQE
ncbi:MAG TPA: Asp-tRNA(Asn)/Glu-tRNA(Gln) amidotransferase subunit GatC [Candidatus Acetothermia bacterium]|nr:Asp-tRNA(Asn)/Glu-tRNA(Gln) amidotransferase subunit GatC [Candidatus Acetothermia bacterium]